MSDHRHKFREEDWKFDCAQNTPSYCSEKILDPEYFVEEVYHDHDGDWQFFHNGGDSSTAPKLLCMGCVCEFDAAIFELHDLPIGWFAYRDNPEEQWTRQPYERQEEEEDSD